MRRRRAGGTRPVEAVEAVYDALAPAVLGYFRAHRMADPEGLTGDVFVSVARRLREFEGDDAALRRWVFTIAHHRRVDEIRRGSRSPALVPLDGTVEVRSSLPAHGPVDPDLVAALATLTDDQRQVVLLRHVADLSVADVAEITGRSPGAVKMLTARAIDSLARQLAPSPDIDVELPAPRP
ncbi:MAG TPA: sigma-70 family RNA polymerase sigma factor [Acidimicrobiales bacterium]|nr:sigma-70 family RNA polymerase sigma factor [Acidimicrobiales bacterium]